MHHQGAKFHQLFWKIPGPLTGSVTWLEREFRIIACCTGFRLRFKHFHFSQLQALRGIERSVSNEIECLDDRKAQQYDIHDDNMKEVYETTLAKLMSHEGCQRGVSQTLTQVLT